MEAFFKQLDTFDHLVSMVGDSMSGGFLEVSKETMEHTIHSKFLSNWHIARHGYSRVNPGGSITFTGGSGGRAHEVAASFVANLGISALTQGLAVELAPSIRVNAVVPTLMDTPFWKNIPAESFSQSVPLKRTATIDEVASVYLFLMTNSFITGQAISVDGGVMLIK